MQSARSEAAELTAGERAEIAAELDALWKHRQQMIPEFAETWDPSPDRDPSAMHAKTLELTRLMVQKQGEAERLIVRLERAATPWRRVLRARARAERCLRVMQLKRLRAVEPVMAKLHEALDKPKLMQWLHNYVPSRVEVMEMEQMVRDAEEAIALMAERPELALELGYLLESVHSVAGQCAVLIGEKRRDLKATMDRAVHGVVQRAAAAAALMARLFEKVWASVYQHGNAYGSYHEGLAADARALETRWPAARPGLDHLLRVIGPR